GCPDERLTGFPSPIRRSSLEPAANESTGLESGLPLRLAPQEIDRAFGRDGVASRPADGRDLHVVGYPAGRENFPQPTSGKLSRRMEGQRNGTGSTFGSTPGPDASRPGTDCRHGPGDGRSCPGHETTPTPREHRPPIVRGSAGRLVRAPR